jgi:DNA-binding LacI/PurR family transcriptional regulator
MAQALTRILLDEISGAGSGSEHVISPTTLIRRASA